eukprot:CAMPEP_0184486916 /NCGR_PEP_ID=MMETSP0113_2-20130426/8789_1 /TAXON_ID=91329 /ORGANISM="Norrisiella sphaerica, Strain BC52" /LENGTH=492 /DNA_ID=CAMNT_0026868995 /DNA_START=250 /DNA_END=1728 /DNA_ORIENTATION=+
MAIWQSSSYLSAPAGAKSFARPLSAMRIPSTSLRSYNRQTQSPGFRGVSPFTLKKRALMPLRAVDTSSEEERVSCKIDDIENCSVAELQVLYVDALWNYYNGGKWKLSDAEFDRIKSELCWQGSGFPTLRRWEVEFVQAALSYYRGEPVVSDEKYEALKQKVRESGKRQDVTAMLLYTKGQEALTPEQFEKFSAEMRNLGMDVCVQTDALQCTLSDTTDKLQNDVREIINMYSAIGVIPQTVALSAWALLSLLVGGPGGLVTNINTIPIAGLGGAAIAAIIIKYLGLDRPEFLKGTCPCCESEVMSFFGPNTPTSQEVGCESCGTKMVLDSDLGRITSAGGFEYLTNSTAEGTVSFSSRDIVKGVAGALSSALPTISSPELRKSDKPKRAKNEKEPIGEQLTTGIFAWAVLLGYGLFGEQFVGRVRGKGIALHSGVINDFCARFKIPNKMRQKYIQTAKKNGHDLGFLVPGGYFGDGLAGDAAMKWWKSTGW